MNSGTFLSPDGKYELGFVLTNDEFYTGFITNTGCNKQWVIEYDKDFTLDENLQMLYETVNQEWK